MKNDLQQEDQIEQEFILEFPTELGIDSFLVKTKMPSANLNPGKNQMYDLDITILDVIEPSTYFKIKEWIEYGFGYLNARFRYAMMYKKNIVIKLKNTGEEPLKKWVLVGCLIKYKHPEDFRVFSISFDRIISDFVSKY